MSDTSHYANNYSTRFRQIWPKLLREDRPYEDSAAADLMYLLEDVFEIQSIQHTRAGNAVSFLFDLSSLGFSGMGWNVVVVSPPPANQKDARWQARFLTEQKYAADSTGFCFHVYLCDEMPPRNEYVGVAHEAVFLCRRDLAEIISAKIPKMAFAAAVRKQTPVSRLCPFNTTHEASGAMFYGRRAELNMVAEDLSKSVAVQGARRIGKTSLLRHGYRILRSRLGEEGPSRAFYFNCLTWGSYTHACHILAHKIDPKRELRLDRAERNVEYMIERSSRNGTRPLYLFFDESDRLIDLDAANNWKFFNLLAWAKDAGMIRFVLAGYRSVGRLVYGSGRGRGADASAIARTPDTPLWMALEPLNLTPLSRRDSDSLLTEPLRGTEVRIENEPLVRDRVWKATGGYPFLVQFFGQHLFNLAVERTPHSISPDDIEVVEQSPDLREFLETHFIENTLHNGVPAAQERACAFLFAHANDTDWTEQDFWEACREYKVPLGADELSVVHKAVKNLSDAQVLTYAQGRYSFAFPVMREVLTSSYPDVKKALRALVGATS